MRITRREHATLVVETDSGSIVIDPGSFTEPSAPPDDLVAVVVTHEHPDHWTPEHLRRLRAHAPDAPVYGPEGVARAAGASGITVVSPGDSVVVEPFTLRFFGGRHAVIHDSVPVVDNVGVLVDERFYYPGDSYALPGVDVEMLAAPLGAPWLKIGDAMDFLLAVAPDCAFGVHDATLSDAGRQMHRARLEWAVTQGGGEFLPIAPGEDTEI